MYGIIWLAVVPLTIKLIVCGGLLLINILQDLSFMMKT